MLYILLAIYKGHVCNSLKTLIFIKKFTVDDISISGSDYIAIPSVYIAQNGYTPIGIFHVSFENATNSGTGCSYLNCFSAKINGNYADLAIKNYRTSTSKVKIIMDVLYAKN